MRLRDTIEFLGLWESLSNPDFKPIEFDRFKKESGYNAFTLSPQKWIKSTNAIGIISKSGRYGGAFAHKDIAFEFASWISVEFKLYVIRDYQRLKEKETSQKEKRFKWLLRLLNGDQYSINNEKLEWKKVKLGDVCKVRTGKFDANAMVKDGEYRFYTCVQNYYKIDRFVFDTEALIISGMVLMLGISIITKANLMPTKEFMYYMVFLIRYVFNT